MIDFNRIRHSTNKYVDGQLDDGRLVEFKVRFPSNLDSLVQQIVTIANTEGGFIIFGVVYRLGLSVVGLRGDYNEHINRLETAIKTLSLGITYSLSHKVFYGKDIVILEINKADTTAYFSRTETSPARQISYWYSKNEGEISISKEEMRYSKVYKYMTLDAFLSSLYSKAWRFYEPSKWNDRYEQRFYCANYLFPAAIGNTPQLFATCLTKAKNSEAAWKVYSNGQGLGAHCVQLELDIVELRKQLKSLGHRFEEKTVVYENENIILNLHKNGNKYYSTYFSSFSIYSFLKLLSLKRDAYQYEQELRLFVIPQNGGDRNVSKKARSIDLNINWRDVILKVRVDKKCSDSELTSIQRACLSVGLNPVIKGYTFIGSGNIVSSANSKDIEFERFDIDDMPGPSKITIA